jgi:hypothetical protein
VVGGRVGAYFFGTGNGNQAVRQSAGGKAFCGAVLHKHLFVIRDEYYSLPRQLHLMGASENMAAPKDLSWSGMCAMSRAIRSSVAATCSMPIPRGPLRALRRGCPPHNRSPNLEVWAAAKVRGDDLGWKLRPALAGFAVEGVIQVSLLRVLLEAGVHRLGNRGNCNLYGVYGDRGGAFDKDGGLFDHRLSPDRLRDLRSMTPRPLNSLCCCSHGQNMPEPIRYVVHIILIVRCRHGA